MTRIIGKPFSKARASIGASAFLISALTINLSLAIGSFTRPSSAACAPEPMSGTWENVDTNTRGITVVNYIWECNDVILCPVGEPCPSPPRTRIKVFGSCHPTDCDWGESLINFHSDRNWRYATYDQGFANRIVWLRMETNGQLTVVEDVDYQDGRTDRVTWYRFNKVI